MSKRNAKKQALDYHQYPTPGKLEVIPTTPHSSQKDLALAYSPGVAEPCLEIEKDPSKAYDYTSKGNLVAVISNGTAVLGLGDIGAEASKPVMEGKGLLFKIFADIDVFDIEVNEKDPDKFVEIVKAIAPTFGGINLEDIKAPEAFLIEDRLKEELNIPVMHDDQHGTAIISGAALLNALELANKKIEDVRIVVNGAGAAAISCSNIYIELGAKREHILMADSKGIIHHDRLDSLSDQKKQFATKEPLYSLEEALKDADVFIGLSKGDVLTPEMLNSMGPDPIVFAMANPVPEIDYDLAMATREDVLMATGRSDHPNQVNNVLGFPYIFRGALDVRASTINMEMKIAAVHAVANLAKELVPQEVSSVYNEVNLSFGKEYIIPKPFDPRLAVQVSMAVGKAAIESGVAKRTNIDWEAYATKLEKRVGVNNEITKMLQAKTMASKATKRLVFCEADEFNVLKAIEICKEDGIAEPVLLGNKAKIHAAIEEHDLNLDFESLEIHDPKADESETLRDKYAEHFWKKKQRRGVRLYDAQKIMRERNYFGSMMVDVGDADAMVTGYTRSYAASSKPILDSLDLREGINKAVGMMIVITHKGPVFLSDVALNEDPSAEEIVEITKLTHDAVKQFGTDPRVALLSYSNMGSSKMKSPRGVSQAVKTLHETYPDMIVDGELQADIALSKEKIQEYYPFSKLAGGAANTLIFPNLSAGNISYRMMTGIRESDELIGPILLGLEKPVHILQMGSDVKDIVNMAMVAVYDAQYILKN